MWSINISVTLNHTGRSVALFEITIPDEFGIEPSNAGVVDLLEEYAIHARSYTGPLLTAMDREHSYFLCCIAGEQKRKQECQDS